MKKLISILSCLCLICNLSYAELVRIDELKGLQRNPKADRIQDGGHTDFQNVYINYGNIEVVKGRQKLNTSAVTSPIFGLAYYENQGGSIKKLIVATYTSIKVYDLDGTNELSIASGIFYWFDSVQIGDTLYFTTPSGMYKWSGSGSATLLQQPAASVAISASALVAPAGNQTTGNDMSITPQYQFDSGSYWRGTTGTGECTQGVPSTSTPTQSNWCTSLVNVNRICATSTIYCYKAVQYNTITGIQSEASSAACAYYPGKDYAVVTAIEPFPVWGNATCSGAAGGTYYNNIEYNISNNYTNTQIGIGGITSPFNAVKIYRTTAGGGDYFFLGQGSSGYSYDGKADTSLGDPLDTTIDMISPPVGRYIEEYKGAIFTARDNIVKFTRLPVNIIPNADIYWLDSDELEVPENITGLQKVSDSLLIFTKQSIYQVTGFGVTTFRLTPIVQGVGSIGDETIEVDANGDVIFSAGTEGIYKLAVGQQPTDSATGSIIDTKNARLTKLSSPWLDNVLRGTDNAIPLNPTWYGSVYDGQPRFTNAYYDRDYNRYFFYMYDKCFMFDNTNGQWTYMPASLFVNSVYRKSTNGNGVGVLVDYYGFFYNNWTSYTNGITSGTVTGYPTLSTNTTLTCSTCTFNTTGDGLKSIWVFIDNENQEFRQIVSNTATELTVNTAWTTNPINTDKFYIGYIHTKWTTKQYALTQVPNESFITKFYINHNKSDSSQKLLIRSFQKKANIAVNEFEIDLNTDYVDTINTRMRSNWVQWGFTSHVYNTSNSINPPIDIVSYAIEAEEREGVD